MAHGNYICCAICDMKISFGDNAAAKTQICTYCAVDLAKGYQLYIGTVAEFMNFINVSGAEKVKRVLSELGFQKCYYGNPVDDAVEAKLPGVFSAERGK